VAWSLVGLFGAAALVLGLMFVGASSDADDAESERDEVLAELDDTAGRLEDADNANGELEDKVDSLEDERDALEEQIEELEGQIEPKDIDDEHALALGTWLWGPDDPLTDAEAICLGKAFYATVDHAALVFYLSTPEEYVLPDWVYDTIDVAYAASTRECDI
jgi:hypothetical protein